MKKKKKITENKKYIGLRFGGKWWSHIDCDDEMVTNYDAMITNMLETDAIDNIYKSDNPVMVKHRDTLTNDDMLKLIDNYIADEKAIYDTYLKDTSLIFRSLSKCRDQLFELCTSPKFYKFIQIAMKCREIHRRKEYGVEDDSIYVIPDQVTKMSDLKQNIIDNDELIFDE